MNSPQRLVRASLLCLSFCLFLLPGFVPRRALAQGVLDTIRFGGDGPPFGYSGFAVNSLTNTIYIANNNAISVVDGATNTLKTTIALDRPAESLAVNARTNRVYATASNDNNVVVIDSSANKVLPSFALPASVYPSGVAVDADKNLIYVSGNEYIGRTRAVVYSLDGSASSGNPTLIYERDAYQPLYPYASTIDDKFFSFQQIAVNPACNRIYVLGQGYRPYGSHTTTYFDVLDRSTYKPVGGEADAYGTPTNMAMDPTTGNIYVAGYVSGVNNLSFYSAFDCNGLPLPNSYLVSLHGAYLTGGSSNHRVYSNGGDAINTDTNTVIALNPLYAAMRVINPATNTFYALPDYRNRVIEARRESDGNLLASIAFGYQPMALAVDAVNHRLYVAQTTGLSPNAVSIVDTLTDTTLANVTYSDRAFDVADDRPTAIAADSSAQIVYVATNSGMIAVIDGRTLTLAGTIDLGFGNYHQLTDIAVDSATHTVYAADGVSVYVIDGITRTLTATLTNFDSFDYPTKLIWNPATQTLNTLGNYNAGDRGGVTHSIVSMLHKNAAGDYEYTTISLPDGSYGVAVALNSATDTLYITNDPSYGSDAVLYALNGATQAITSVDPNLLSIGAYGIAVDSTANILYVTDRANNQVALVDGSSYATIKTVPVGQGPTAIAFDAVTGHAYSLDFDSQQVSVIGTSGTPVDVSAQITVTPASGFRLNAATGKWTRQYRVTNTGAALSGPLSLVLMDLGNAVLTNGNGVTQAFQPAGKPYKTLTAGVFGPGSAQSLLITLEFSKTSKTQPISLSSFKIIQGSNR